MTIDDRYSINGLPMIMLSSEYVSISIIPELGGVITSIKHIPSNTELLAQVRPPDNRSVYRESRIPDNLLDLLFVGGYYEVLPNAGYACNYGGVPLGLHDETPYLPWKCEFDEERDPDSILLISDLRKFPLKLFKRITVRGDEVRIDETLFNKSPTSRIPFSWLHHPTFGDQFIDEDSRLILPEGTQIEVDSILESETTCLQAGYKGNWPMAREKDGSLVDLSRFPPKGRKNCDDLVYIPKVVEGKFTIISPNKRLAVEALWDSELFGSLWLWRPFGGGNSYPWWGTMYCTAVEITTSIPAAGLEEQVKLGTAKWIEPGQKISTTLKYRIKRTD